jgi:hypothetical protein
MSGELNSVVNAYFLSSPRFWIITGIQATTGLATALALLFVIQMANPVTSATATIIRVNYYYYYYNINTYSILTCII